MPLKSGKSNETIGKNVAQLRKENKPKGQAVAIALNKAGKTQKETPKK